jgi:hypothetical protein
MEDRNALPSTNPINEEEPLQPLIVATDQQRQLCQDMFAAISLGTRSDMQYDKKYAYSMLDLDE